MESFRHFLWELLFMLVAAVTAANGAQIPTAGENGTNKVSPKQGDCDAGSHKVPTSFGSYCAPDQGTASVPPPDKSARFVDCKKITSAVSLRRGPDSQSPVVASVPCGAMVRQVQEKGGWVKVRTNAGIEGYVSFVMLSEKPVFDTEGTDPAEGSDAANSEAYALRATLMLRDIMKDPASFTPMEVVAIEKRDKDPHKKSSFRGCIHYVASNSYGGRQQAWGGYYVDKRGQIKVFPGELGGDPTFPRCMYSNSKETSTDVTDKIAKSLGR